jgi:hypothetical protein
MIFKWLLIIFYVSANIIWGEVLSYQIKDADMSLKKYWQEITLYRIICNIIFIGGTILNIIMFYFTGFLFAIGQKIEKHEGFLFKKINKHIQ